MSDAGIEESGRRLSAREEYGEAALSFATTVLCGLQSFPSTLQSSPPLAGRR
jgi:hypothetical protein